MSLLFMVVGMYMYLLPPALPKQAMVLLVQLQGCGGMNTDVLIAWYIDLWSAAIIGWARTNILAPSAEPVISGAGLAVVVPVQEQQPIEVRLGPWSEVMPEMLQLSVTTPSNLLFMRFPSFGIS